MTPASDRSRSTRHRPGPEARAAWQHLRLPAAVAGSVLAAVAVYGRMQLGHWSEPGGRTVALALVQGDIPEEWRTSLRFLPAVLERYRDLVARAAHDRPGLVVLPENAAGVSPAANPRVVAQIAEPLTGSDALLLMGAPRTVSSCARPTRGLPPSSTRAAS